VLHRHKQEVADGAEQGQAAQSGKWEKVVGNIVNYQVLPGPQAPHPKLYIVELHPEGCDPVQARLRSTSIQMSRNYNDDLFLGSVGDVTGFLFNPSTGEAAFDMDDPRNSLAAHNEEADKLMEALLSGMPAAPGESVTGPPWVVPAVCPTCSAPVDQAKASMDLAPMCAYCHQPLPVQPRARF
jgi:hypothetical protein